MAVEPRPPLTAEQERMIAWWRDRMEPLGVSCGTGRTVDGQFLAQFWKDAWAAWQEAKKVPAETGQGVAVAPAPQFEISQYPGCGVRLAGSAFGGRATDRSRA